MSICKVAAKDVARVLSDRQFAQAVAEGGDEAGGLALDTEWKTMHHALTGEAWTEQSAAKGPLHRAVRGDGGAEVDAVDCGWGPGRLLEPSVVKEIAAALSHVGTIAVAQRLLAAAGRTPWSMEDAELMIGDEYELFDDLKDLYAEAAEDGAGLLFTFT